ncbi:unnamed protein product [Somion occarium]|uniref:Uncharacterized protein n=1 Tax=Somion occarium TaxID=3059160 RepID=A0ABP1CMT4_9APHY
MDLDYRLATSFAFLSSHVQYIIHFLLSHVVIARVRRTMLPRIRTFLPSVRHFIVISLLLAFCLLLASRHVFAAPQSGPRAIKE